MSLYLESVVVGLVVLGAGVMGLAIFKTRQIISWLKREACDQISEVQISEQSLQRWRVMSALMTFFLFGYSLAAYLVSSQRSDWLTILTGVVFFFGALFVLFSVSVYAATLRQLIASQISLRAQTNQATQTLAQLKQVQRDQMLTIQTEKMRSLNQMSAGIAHEINNPANFIHGNLLCLQEYANDLLRLIVAYQEASAGSQCNWANVAQIEEEIDLDFIRADFSKAINSMKLGSDRIRRIVGSMRNFSRLDESQCKLADIAQGIESTLVMLQGKINDSTTKIEVVTQFDPTLAAVYGNHGAINQALLQILSNAVDAFVATDLLSSSQLPTIKINTQQIDSSWVQITVADNGSGIKDTDIKYIFDPFFTTKPIGTGTGLGLAVSHQIIVEQHGGYLDCHSQVGKGTTFQIRLPTSSPTSQSTSLPTSRSTP